jgi:hypothetical protein
MWSKMVRKTTFKPNADIFYCLSIVKVMYNKLLILVDGHFYSLKNKIRIIIGSCLKKEIDK